MVFNADWMQESFAEELLSKNCQMFLRKQIITTYPRSVWSTVSCKTGHADMSCHLAVAKQSFNEQVLSLFAVIDSKRWKFRF